MGTNPKYVFNYGCPAMDVLHKENLKISNKLMSQYGGTGAKLDWDKEIK